MDISMMVNAISSAGSAISNIVTAVSNGKTERARIYEDGRKFDKEIEDKICAREEETKKFYAEQQAKLDKLSMEIKQKQNDNKVQRKRDADNHAERMAEIKRSEKKDKQEHEEIMKRIDKEYDFRMALLSVVRDSISRAYSDIDVYREERIRYGEALFSMEGVIAGIADATTRLNSVAQTLMLQSGRN